jgi:hypothetical protein
MRDASVEGKQAARASWTAVYSSSLGANCGRTVRWLGFAGERRLATSDLSAAGAARTSGSSRADSATASSQTRNENEPCIDCFQWLSP